MGSNLLKSGGLALGVGLLPTALQFGQSLLVKDTVDNVLANPTSLFLVGGLIALYIVIK